MKHLWTWLAFALAAVLATGAYLGLTALLLSLEGWEWIKFRILTRGGRPFGIGSIDHNEVQRIRDR